MLQVSMTAIELALKVKTVIGAIFFCDSTSPRGARHPVATHYMRIHHTGTHGYQTTPGTDRD